MAHLSTIVGPKVKQIVRGTSEKVIKPIVVLSYTWYMGGVDLQDQKRSCAGTPQWQGRSPVRVVQVPG